MNRKSFLLLVATLSCLAVLLFFLNQGYKKSKFVELQDLQVADTSQAREAEAVKDANLSTKNDEVLASENNRSECLTIMQLSQSEDWIKLQDWHKSWGSPTFHAYSHDSILQTESPYLYEKEETLIQIYQYVPEAAYALGMNMIWTALAEVEVSPMLTAEPDISNIKWRQKIDYVRLTKGREILYEAAVNGHIYSLIELSMSYAYQLNNIESTQQLPDEAIEELKLNAIKYGELAESLIEGVSENFFQTRYQKELSSEEFEQLIRNEKERFLNFRQQKGLGELKIVAPSQYFDMAVPCAR